MQWIGLFAGRLFNEMADRGVHVSRVLYRKGDQGWEMRILRRGGYLRSVPVLSCRYDQDPPCIVASTRTLLRKTRVAEWPIDQDTPPGVIADRVCHAFDIDTKTAADHPRA